MNLTETATFELIGTNRCVLIAIAIQHWNGNSMRISKLPCEILPKIVKVPTICAKRACHVDV